MVKRPKHLGFKLGLKVHIGRPSFITKATPDASKVRDVVYVALLAGKSGALKKGDALKIGQTGGTLRRRWRGIVGIFDPSRRLRNNEKDDRDKFLKVAKGKEISVWMREAGKIEIPYAKGLTRVIFSTRAAEEEFLDEYYQPSLGKRLNSGRPTKPTKFRGPN
jgi:hypothetical protein